MKQEYFVYYHDGYYYDDDGVGMESFDTLAGACLFIENRIKENPTERKIDCYTLILGKAMDMQAVETVTKIIAS